MRLHRCNVSILYDWTLCTISCTWTNEVVVVTSVPVEDYIQAVIEETKVCTNVKLMLLLIGQILICELTDIQTWLLIDCEWTPDVGTADNYLWVGNSWLITCQWVRCTKSSVSQRVLECLLEPWLFVNIPYSWYVPSRQPTCRTCLTQSVTTLVTGGEVSCIASFPRVVSCTEEWNITHIAVAQLVIEVTVFHSLLEVVVVVTRKITHIILHADTVVSTLFTNNVVDFHTTI